MLSFIVCVGVDGDGGVGRSVGLDLVRRKSSVYWRSFSRPSFILLSKSVADRLFNQPLREMLSPPDQAGSCFVDMTRTHCCISEGLNWTEASHLCLRPQCCLWMPLRSFVFLFTQGMRLKHFTILGALELFFICKLETGVCPRCHIDHYRDL